MMGSIEMVLMGVVLACLSLAIFTVQKNRILQVLVLAQVVATGFVVVSAAIQSQGWHWLVLPFVGALQVHLVVHALRLAGSNPDRLTTLKG